MRVQNPYSLHDFNKAYQEIIAFADSYNLDLTKCSIDVINCADSGLHILCYDNVSQRMFGLSLRKDSILPFNWKKHTVSPTTN